MFISGPYQTCLGLEEYVISKNGEYGLCYSYHTHAEIHQPTLLFLSIGWDQGLLGMCVGEKRKLKIPAKMGYGDRGSPPKIPGMADNLFVCLLGSST